MIDARNSADREPSGKLTEQPTRREPGVHDGGGRNKSCDLRSTHCGDNKRDTEKKERWRKPGKKKKKKKSKATRHEVGRM